MLNILILFLSMNGAGAGTWTFLADDTLKFEGQVIEGEARRFHEKFSDKITRIVVDSPGGLVSEGLLIGNTLYGRDITVEVQGICLSACANYFFLAAKRKVIGRGVVGFHGNQNSWLKHILHMQNTAPKFLWLSLMRFTMDLDEWASEEQILAKLERRKISSLDERAFFEKIGVPQELFERSSWIDRGKGDHKKYSMWLPSRQSFELYGIYGIEGEQSMDVVNTDPRIVLSNPPMVVY
jgi:hypothetical protein